MAATNAAALNLGAVGARDPLLAATPQGNVLSDTLRLIKETPLAALGVTVLPRRPVDEDDEDDADEVLHVLPTNLKDLVAAKKRYLFGVSFEEISTAAIFQLAAARATGAPQELVKDLVFSVFVGYTVSRDWAVEYQNLHSSSILRSFEIDGRVVDRSDPLFAKNSWVNSSKMNSTAAHLLAYLVVESAPSGGVLHRLKTLKGTPFSDATKKTPQGLLITEMAKSLDASDRAAARKFGESFGVLVRVVDLIMGDAGANLDDAIAKANKFKPAVF